MVNAQEAKMQSQKAEEEALEARDRSHKGAC